MPMPMQATATADRVATELSTTCGGSGAVGVQIRADASRVNSNTKIKFMTDGILLQEITKDLMLWQYSVIVLDEVSGSVQFSHPVLLCRVDDVIYDVMIE